jgi:hypothetical protein
MAGSACRVFPNACTGGRTSLNFGFRVSHWELRLSGKTDRLTDCPFGRGEREKERKSEGVGVLDCFVVRRAELEWVGYMWCRVECVCSRARACVCLGSPVAPLSHPSFRSWLILAQRVPCCAVDSHRVDLAGS